MHLGGHLGMHLGALLGSSASGSVVDPIPKRVRVMATGIATTIGSVPDLTASRDAIFVTLTEVTHG